MIYLSADCIADAVRRIKAVPWHPVADQWEDGDEVFVPAIVCAVQTWGQNSPRLRDGLRKSSALLEAYLRWLGNMMRREFECALTSEEMAQVMPALGKWYPRRPFFRRRVESYEPVYTGPTARDNNRRAIASGAQAPYVAIGAGHRDYSGAMRQRCGRSLGKGVVPRKPE